MMKFFRPDDSSSSLWKYIFWGAVMMIIIFSFFWQMSLGLCPVP